MLCYDACYGKHAHAEATVDLQSPAAAKFLADRFCVVITATDLRSTTWHKFNTKLPEVSFC